MTGDQRDHIARVLRAHNGLTQRKYEAGQVEHGGNCWQKPGMLAHALDEHADLTVYLQTTIEQLSEVASDLRKHGLPDWAERIERVLVK